MTLPKGGLTAGTDAVHLVGSFELVAFPLAALWTLLLDCLAWVLRLHADLATQLHLDLRRHHCIHYSSMYVWLQDESPCRMGHWPQPSKLDGAAPLNHAFAQTLASTGGPRAEAR